jgi:hypothetical protein
MMSPGIISLTHILNPGLVEIGSKQPTEINIYKHLLDGKSFST